MSRSSPFKAAAVPQKTADLVRGAEEKQVSSSPEAVFVVSVSPHVGPIEANTIRDHFGALPET